jgi:G patch domain-containing protein 1
MSQKDRERLQNFAASGGFAAPTTSGPPPSTTVPSQPVTIRIPRTEPHIAQAALRGFQPFATDPNKQSRYNAYLQSQASQDSSVPPVKPSPGQRIDEFNKELEDYAKAALLFKPISGAMAGRFTSAVVFESGPKIHEGLHTPSSEELAEKEREEQKKREDNISPKEHAAKAGMYGPLTRETKPWQPARLLCKRFGVKDPNPAPEIPSDAPPAAPSGSNWQQEASEVAGQESNASVSNSAVDTVQRNGPRDLANIGLGEDENQGRDTLTYERPAMDVFRAIFASDDEDSDDDEAKNDENEDDEIGGGDNIAFKPPIQADKTDAPQLGASTLAANTPASETVVADMSSFKPTFIPRDKRSKDKDRDKDRKEKKKKEKKVVLVSFEMDEEGGGESISEPKPPKDRPKKKKRKEKEKHGDDDDGMWVEKPTSEAVKDLLLPQPTSEPLSTMDDSASAGPVKGRKRAIDFM